MPARVQIWMNCHEHRLHAKNFANNWYCMLQNATHSFSDANFKICCIKLWCTVTASLLNYKGNEVTTHNEANSCYLWTITLKNHIGMTQSSWYFSSLFVITQNGASLGSMLVKYKISDNFFFARYIYPLHDFSIFPRVKFLVFLLNIWNLMNFAKIFRISFL